MPDESTAPAAGRQPRIVLISQTFSPDPASVGQHMSDAAREMARRGYEVRVYTSARGYENPALRFIPREIIPGEKPGEGPVIIRRLPLASFGKRSILTRVIGTASFQMQVLWHQLTIPRLAGIFFSTSPPLVGVTACIAGALRGVPTAYWAMDLNPDQLIAMKKIKPRSLIARFLEAANRFILRRTTRIIALDRFMRERLLARGDFSRKLDVTPPWPHEDCLDPVAPETNPFRQKHGLSGKRVIMYSGNHSPANPLSTLLRAAIAFKDDDRVQFVFVGGGLGKKEVEACIGENNLSNMISLPYQPMADLKYSLSTADVHVVSMGGDMVGVIHPCKIYGAMAVGRPVLYLGPSPSHIADILGVHECGWQVSHGDIEGMKKRIAAILEEPAGRLAAMGATAQRVLRETLSQEILQRRLGDQLEETFPRAPGKVQPQPDS